jgi:Fe-S cluster biosynthesis and repair protein YggX
MPKITCSCCGTTAEGLEKAPLPGAPGELVLARTCPACWKRWLDEQVRLINEYRLSPVNPEHFDFLIKEMKRSLKLEER